MHVADGNIDTCFKWELVTHSYCLVLALRLNIKKKEHHLGACCIIAQLICSFLVMYKPINIWNARDEIGSVHDWSNPASKTNKEMIRLYACHAMIKTNMDI